MLWSWWLVWVEINIKVFMITFFSKMLRYIFECKHESWQKIESKLFAHDHDTKTWVSNNVVLFLYSNCKCHNDLNFHGTKLFIMTLIIKKLAKTSWVKKLKTLFFYRGYHTALVDKFNWFQITHFINGSPIKKRSSFFVYQFSNRLNC